MTGLNHLTLADARRGLDKKEFTAVELVESHIKAVEQTRNLNAYMVESFDHARSQAHDSDQRLAKGEGRALEGIPVAVKDLFCTKGFLSTSCSKILKGFTPTYESTVTTNLFNHGAVMVGKTNMDEFAMGSANTTSCYGSVINPWRRKSDQKDLVPGGSSGGSAAAVASYSAMGALGSDTGGSIRQPGAFTGTVGIKPTYGRCSRYGMIAFASSLDQAGVFSRTVMDSALLLEAICGYDPKDSTSANVAVPEFSKAVGQSIAGKRVGIPKEYAQNLPADIKALWDQGIAWLTEAGAKPVDISLPHTKYALATYYIIAPAEASSNLARYDGLRFGQRVCDDGDSLDDMYEKTRQAGFGDEVKRRIMIGTYVLSAGYYDAYYMKAQRVRNLISQDFQQAFQDVDVILTPATPSAAFALDEKLDPLTMYLNDVYTVPASLAGIPGMVVPAGLSTDGLPLGLQLLGPMFGENTLFSFAHVIEQQAGFKLTPHHSA
ncbi:MAG: Asp-tRNA(Asn)/Glu-tRNA(Gln) amidotransferase subunit GatA [Alphaproteobacteria bacterium]|nr:Asp-tRNA(Asn)/Glu-tRNA(Gln) amidotransferase subunit GatA [Alphaproteobacteria bacterium]